MDTQYATIDEPATAEYVLEVLRDMHRQQCQHDPVADPEADLTFESTVSEWREACDLVGWRKLGNALNGAFEIDIAEADWHEVLVPSNHRCLEDVCELIAKHLHRPRIRPAQLFGSRCHPAGAFLTIRSLLGKAGVDIENIAPSTELESYTRQYCEVFLGPISRLAPGSLPPVHIRNPVHACGLRLLLIGFGCIALAACTKVELLGICSICFLLLGFVLECIGVGMLPASVTFGNLRTFRDLATVIAKADSIERSTTSGV